MLIFLTFFFLIDGHLIETKLNDQKIVTIEQDDHCNSFKKVDQHIGMIWSNLDKQKRFFEDLILNHTLYSNSEPNDSLSINQFLFNDHFDPALFIVNENEASVFLLQKYLLEIFSQPRSHQNLEVKNKVRSAIIKIFQFFNLEVKLQKFQAYSSNSNEIEGLNIIGIRSGNFRGTKSDKILVIGAHYDTVSQSPGVDDNGSGIAAIFETTRLLSIKADKLNHTVILVAFDLEEKGILGSLAFISKYLIPEELLKRKAKFFGAYILDMVLNFDENPASQVIPYDISRAVPKASLSIRRNKFKGDFLALWARKKVDWSLQHVFEKAWTKINNKNIKNLVIFDPPIPQKTIFSTNYRYRNFLRSDHAAFWLNQEYSDSLNAVLLTDMGPWRGVERECYHSLCDDYRIVTPQNLNFLKKVADTLFESALNFFES